MISLTTRLYKGETDLQAISELLNACEAVDQLDQGVSVSELRQISDDPSLDKMRDIRLWEDANGKLIGIGHLWIPTSGKVINGFLSCHVAPRARNENLERHIITWGKERMREVKQERGLNATLCASAHDQNANFIAPLESSGFKSDRYVLTMRRTLKESIPEPQLPTSFTLRQVKTGQDAKAWVEMYNQSFIDHPNHRDLEVEHYKNHWSNHTYRPDLDLVAIAPDGTFAAFCECKINLENNTHTGRNQGWILKLGTRRGFRRIGLGRAMLLSGMRQLQAAGMDIIKLSVDLNNPNGALQLYESVGFHKLYTMISYIKDI
ncbi:GNAT family N-acetyltransferase [Dendronalium sp. ChiSLP03b]|uniref:GNAT family N-acetyltransferase n=1 Tax=Dendronalium sp. ChiSLP03b TaxID=3075381 RepID=UPI002AD21745|nr:GNAT family N-acetyltransferase [Dendronalium sp. ChiSLP03b]MDZ8206609.1 GNAT family N-acetyltransferase [Dendronalium sp. ChiSLP03b]